MKKKILLFIVGLFLITINQNVYAGNLDVEIKETNYYYKIGNESTKKYKYSELFYGNTVLYSHNPNDKNTLDYSQTDKLNLVDSFKDKVLKASYYGYDYPNHQTLKYKMATQAIIWESMLKDKEILFYKEENDSLIDLTKEKEEIKKLMENHDILPDFKNNEFNISLYNNLNLIDENKVLDNFLIENNQNINIEVNRNNLIISSNALGTSKIKLIKKNIYDNDSLAFIDSNYNYLFSAGSINEVSKYLTINTIDSGYVNVNLIDKDNNNLGNKTLEKGVYGIYDSITKELIEEIETDINGTCKSNILPHYGNYFIKEINPSYGYMKTEELYYFDYQDIEDKIEIVIEKEPIKKELQLNFKTIDNKNILEDSNIEVSVYFKDGTLYDTFKVESDKLKIELPYGEFIIKQDNDSKYYEKFEPIEVTINEEENTLNYEISLSLIKRYLEIDMVDLITKELIKDINFEFKLYNIDKNEYICNNDNCIYTTDLEGTIIIPIELTGGNYRIEEIDKYLPGYLWNNEAMTFKISNYLNHIDKNDKKIIKVELNHKKVSGIINIKVLEEMLNYKSNPLYKTKNSSNVYIGIYNENNELIERLITDQYGSIKYQIPLGNYYLFKENREGYKLDDKEYHFSITYRDQYTELVETNMELIYEMIKGNLDLTLTGDFSKCPNIEIYDNEGQAILDIDILLDNQIISLPVGNYYISKNGIKQIEFEIKEGTTTTISYHNNLELTNVPSTGNGDIPLNNLISLFTFLIIACYVKKD